MNQNKLPLLFSAAALVTLSACANTYDYDENRKDLSNDINRIQDEAQGRVPYPQTEAFNRMQKNAGARGLRRPETNKDYFPK